VDRYDDVNDITNLFQSTKLVPIFGLPAVGKSTLAIHVGYKMARRGTAVRYINVDETHIFKCYDKSKRFDSTLTENHDQKPTQTLAVSKATDITLPWYSHTETRFVSTTAQGLIEWAKGLSNSTLLILDNCDSLLQGKEGRNSDFIGLLDALSKASPYLRTVTTSRLKVKLLDAKGYKLKPLDNESAIELLHKVSHHMTRNNSRIINELLDGIPLALKIAGSLFDGIRPPDVIMRELQQNLIETLTPVDHHLDTEKLRPVLRLSYNYLDNATQECALYLSHFPGSFSEEAALHILSNCTNSSPSGCLRNLTHTSLLDKYSHPDQIRYRFHKVIKKYLSDISVESSPNPASMNASFNSSFVSHYTLTLHKFVDIYNELPQDKENGDRFEHDTHNFECLLDKLCLFDQWTVTSVVDFTHLLTCDLIANTLDVRKLLKVGQKISRNFESRMDNISTQVGALETLNIYSNLVLTLRAWIQSFPESECKSVCEDTFLRHGYATRLQDIDKLLTKANINARHFYKKLHFLFYDESICLYSCCHFESLDHHMVKFTTVLFIILNMVTAAKQMQSYAADLLEEVGPYTDFSPVFFMSIAILLSFADFLAEGFLLCVGLYIDDAPVISVYIAVLVDVNFSVFSLTEIIIKHQHHRRVLTNLYYVVLSVLLRCAIWKGMIEYSSSIFCIVCILQAYSTVALG